MYAIISHKWGSTILSLLYIYIYMYAYISHIWGGLCAYWDVLRCTRQNSPNTVLPPTGAKPQFQVIANPRGNSYNFPPNAWLRLAGGCSSSAGWLHELELAPKQRKCRTQQRTRCGRHVYITNKNWKPNQENMQLEGGSCMQLTCCLLQDLPTSQINVLASSGKVVSRKNTSHMSALHLRPPRSPKQKKRCNHALMLYVLVQNSPNELEITQQQATWAD